mgnify:CR=1 FL=1
MYIWCVKKHTLTAVAGFAILFLLYHAAEYMILFKNSAIGFLAFQTLFFVAAYFIAKWQRKPGLAAWGLDGSKPFLKHLLSGLLMGGLLYGTTFCISLFLGVEKVTTVPGFAEILAPLGLFIFGSFFSSFSEDVLTRGYVYHHLKGKVTATWVVFISATIYLFNHIYRLDDGFVTWLYLFLLGVLFVIPLLLTQRLWFTGGLHWAGNGTFYFTHEIIKTEESNGPVSANTVFIIVILLFIPLNYYLLKRTGLVKQPEKPIGNAVVVN